MSAKLRTIQITFSDGVDLPDGWERALDGLIGMVCAQYQRDNPSMTMWPAESGSMPTKYDQGAPVEFDDSGYVVHCHARKDYHGSNPYNPDGPRLKAEARAARKAAKGPPAGQEGGVV